MKSNYLCNGAKYILFVAILLVPIESIAAAITNVGSYTNHWYDYFGDSSAWSASNVVYSTDGSILDATLSASAWTSGNSSNAGAIAELGFDLTTNAYYYFYNPVGFLGIDFINRLTGEPVPYNGQLEPGLYVLMAETGNFWGGDSGGGSISLHVTAVPEPSTMLLLGTGLVGLVGYGRRRFKK